ncbi:hypothetical protein G6F50_017580 [Rhizopus delemar]|uniref:Uncharacterized protein n=1 Tax=Rhizopus delemar TaxID=936053 RepID=A0A9P6XQ81_9FUNG|nr:hypothetical protein G6F50_017580 [Rhizopus delemar]
MPLPYRWAELNSTAGAAIAAAGSSATSTAAARRCWRGEAVGCRFMAKSCEEAKGVLRPPAGPGGRRAMGVGKAGIRTG